MRRSALVFLACLGLSALSGCGGGNGPAPPPPAADAKKVDAATAGEIRGRVVVAGTLPASPMIRAASDPVCARDNKDGISSELYVVDDGGLENVFVYIKDGLGNKYLFDQPTEPVTLDQKGCRYHPHVLGVRVGQPVTIVNSDATLHNVHGLPDVNREFNYGQAITGMKNNVVFTAPEVMIPFKCDVHSWMRAYVGVVNHPYFAVTSGGGHFDLRTVPPGTYTIEAWHEKLGTQTRTVTLGPKATEDITFTFDAKGANS